MSFPHLYGIVSITFKFLVGSEGKVCDNMMIILRMFFIVTLLCTHMSILIINLCKF